MEKTEFEAQQSQSVILYNSILEYIKSQNIDDVFKKIKNDSSKLTINQFKLIGSIGYMFGLDFTSQKNSYNKIIINNWVVRMKEIGLTTDQLYSFENIINSINIDLVIKAKNEVEKLMNKKIKATFEEDKRLKHCVNKIFKGSSFPIQYAIEINEILTKTSIYTYGDLLKINKFIYENLDFPGKLFSNLHKLHSDPVFQLNINRASNHYDLQKFGLVYMEMIITLKEYFSTVERPTGYIEFVENPEEIENIVEVVNPVVEVPTQEVATVSERPTDNISADETDLFLIGVLEEVYNTDDFNKDSIDTIITSFLKTTEDEDVVQYVYKFLKERKSENRIPFEQVFNFNKEEFITKLQLNLTSVQENYKKLVESYLAEFNPEQKQKLVNYINDIISSIIIDNADRKAYLFQQLNENVIHTYKHLQQILGLIEECKIYGSEINSYISLRNYIKNHDEILTIFDSISDIDKFQLKNQFLIAAIEFYTYEDNTDSEKIDEELLKNVKITKTEGIIEDTKK